MNQFEKHCKFLDNEHKRYIKKRKKLRKKQRAKREAYYFLDGLEIVANSNFKNYAEYCGSAYFKKLKREVLRLAGYRCKYCKGKAVTAHHLTYRDKWAGSRLSDCVAVCHPCHMKQHPDKIKKIEL